MRVRWDAAVELWFAVPTIADDGSAAEGERGRRAAFANVRSVGASAYMAARAAGLHADAEVQLRSCDWGGENRARLRGGDYDVEAARTSGDHVFLTLRRRLGT